jgi:hypothetical protein
MPHRSRVAPSAARAARAPRPAPRARRRRAISTGAAPEEEVVHYRDPRRRALVAGAVMAVAVLS